MEVYVFADQTADDITHNHILVMQGTSTLVNALYDPSADVNIEIQQDGSTVLVIVSHIDDDNNESSVTSVSIRTESFSARMNALVKSAVEAPPLSATVVCDRNYARDNPNWRENKYECMRSQIPGVQQLHSALSVLREHNSPRVNAVEAVSTHTLIIDEFSLGRNHGNYVSDVFEVISANLRSTCDVFLPSSVGKCYELMNSKQVGNLSRGVFFERNQQDTSQISQITGDLFTSVGARIALSAGNKSVEDPLSGPSQNGLKSIINLGQTTIVGGWDNSAFVLIMTIAARESLREDAFLISGFLSRRSDSCEDPTGTARTAKWCVLFPYTYYNFNNRGVRDSLGGTSGSVAMYTGVIDLLLTLWPEINSSEADAVVRSCAVDLTYDGYPIAENFFGTDAVSGFEPYYGSEGVDTTTGLGRADLMCLLDSGSDTGLKEDPKSVIDCSFKDDYPHPENREVSRLRISHCEGDVVSPLPVRDVVAQAGDRTINVSWANPSDIGSEGGTNMVTVSLSEESSVIQSVSFEEPVPTEYQFGALQNNVPYDVVLTTFDEAGNTASVSVSATPMDTTPPSAPRRVELSLTETEELSSTAVLEINVFADQTAEDITHNHILVMQSTSTLVDALYNPTADVNIEIQQDGSTVLVIVSHIDDDNNESSAISVSIQTESFSARLNSLVKSVVGSSTFVRNCCV